MKKQIAMKQFTVLRSVAVALLLLAGSSLLRAQMPGGGANGAVSASMLKLFGKNAAFTAKMTVRILDASNQETMTMPMTMAVTDGKVRNDVNMAELKSAMIPPQAIEQMTKMGMDKMTSIVRSDLKKSFQVYPGMKSYLEVPMGAEDASNLEKEPKFEKTELGKETIDGHASVKNKVVITDATGKAQEFTVWNATDLKDFPVQIQVKDNGQNVMMNYTDVKFAKTDAKQFEAPTGFTKYSSMQEFQQAMMQKMMGAASTPAPPK